jgi:tRNA pseudouridine13 synthase
MTFDKDYSFLRVYQSLNLTATIKSSADDFIVEENMSIEMSGEGEHCWIYLKKCHCNTDWIAEQLAKYCGVKRMAVSYAGLKDRRAVTSQWFSVQLPGLPTPDWCDFETSFAENTVGSNNQESVKILQCFRHNKKLQRGALNSNSFSITVRDLSDTSDEVFERLSQRCQSIAEQGVPNYFGLQRFGRSHNNLDQAIKMFSNPRYRLAKSKRGMYLSAARSWMFNCILSERIDRDVWNSRLVGDVFMLDGKSACFKDDINMQGDMHEDMKQQTINQRLIQNEIHPTAVLWGEGDAMVTADAEELESSIIAQYPVYRDGLVAARVQAQRRSCRVVPRDVDFSRQKDDCVITFTLPPGCYATVVLDEIFSQLTVAG